MKIRRRYKNNSKVNILLPLVFLFIVFLSVGYSSLNQELNITSEAVFRVEEDIRITDIKLVGSAFNGIENYNSSYSKDRIKTGITLNEANSSITYQVTITNTGNVPMNLSFLDNINYSNGGITYELNEKLPYMINKGEEKKIELTYKWSSYNELNKNLDSVIRFNFIKAESVLANGTDNATFINNSSFDRSKVESIKFMPTIEVPSSAIEVWDASLNKDGSVMAYTLDNDSNDLYELYIAGYGETKLSEASELFYNFTNMVTLDFDDLVNTSSVTTMENMFFNCSKLESLNLTNFDTSNVTSMKWMFQSCSNIKKLDLSNFNTSKVLLLSVMFEGCSSLDNINLSNFDTSKVVSMERMFNGCIKLHGTLDLSHFNMQNVTTTRNMFSSCKNLNTLKLNNWNTEKLIDIFNMLDGCSSIINVEMNNFSAPVLTSVSGIFSQMTNVQSISINNWNIPKVTNLSGMFAGLVNLTNLNIEKLNASSSSNLSKMFYNCSNLQTLDLSSLDTSNVIDMSNMFYNCKSILNLNISKFKTSKVKNMAWMFQNCSSLIELDLSTFSVESVTNMYRMFDGCSKLENLKLDDWNVEKLTDANDIFRGCTSLTKIDFSLVNSATYEKDIFKSMINQVGDITFYVKDSDCKDLLEAIKPNATVKIKSV